MPIDEIAEANSVPAMAVRRQFPFLVWREYRFSPTPIRRLHQHRAKVSGILRDPD